MLVGIGTDAVSLSRIALPLSSRLLLDLTIFVPVDSDFHHAGGDVGYRKGFSDKRPRAVHKSLALVQIHWNFRVKLEAIEATN